MDSAGDHSQAFIEQTTQKLKDLCHQPRGFDPIGVISDRSIQNITECLKDLEMEEASDRPRTFAVLHMMNRLDLMGAFILEGLYDNSFPYADRRSLPPLMRKDPDACHDFLELQVHVMSTALQMEKGLDSPHVYIDSGDIFFKPLEKLGSGGEATVDKVQSKITKQVYARKRIHRRKDFNKNKEIIAKFENEVQILKKLDHVHLVKVFASYTDRNYVAIIMKPVADMDLKQFLRSAEMRQTLHGSGRSRFRTYYGCLASAISYLHENKIRHKDIKPNNILLKRDDIYITDFGTAVDFEGDASMTKGTVKVTTTQYQSPEVARGAKRGTASDIWSLGVTFLEMTTILRGETLESMQSFLRSSGSKDEYVFENIQGAIMWTEYLRKKAKLPRVDNSPMQWIRDMLAEKAVDRPTASQLAENVRQVADGAFTGQCCRGDGSAASDMSTDEADDDTIIPTATITISAKDNERRLKIKTEPSPLTDEVRPQVESAQRQGPMTASQYTEATLNTGTMPLHRKFMNNLLTYLPTMGSMRFQSTAKASEEDMGGSGVNLSHSVEPENIEVPYSLHIPGAFPVLFSDGETASHSSLSTCHDTPNVPGSLLIARNDFISPVVYTSMTEPVHAYQYTTDAHIEVCPYRNLSTLPEVSPEEDTSQFQPTGISEIDPINAHENVNEAPQDEGVSGQKRFEVEQVDLSFSEDVESEDYLFNPGPWGFVTKIRAPSKESSRALWSFFQQANTSLSRQRSDEHLQIHRVTEFLLSNSEGDSEQLSLHRNRRRGSESDRFGNLQELSRNDMKLELEKSRKAFQGYFTRSPNAIESQSSITNYGLVSSDHSNDQNASPYCLPPNATNNSDNIANINERPEYPPYYIEKYESQRPPTPPKTPPDQSNSNSNPLFAWLKKARGPPTFPKESSTVPKATKPSLLTAENLGIHNKRSATKREVPPPFKIKDASSYMRKVFDDAASSVATSVMSTRTRESFKLMGLMLPLQDRTQNFLGRYTKLGKADAVRMLLREGCNPGTKKDPRPGPIFNTIKGSTSRHTKCLRALIIHGVNVNARLGGKTPLLEAITRDPWPGYITVIYLLLAAGSRPNSKDHSGDSPLLKLLSGGQEPLEDHRRQALALLLSPSYDTDVDVTPLGTQNKPLHLAIRRKDPYAVGMLLEKNDSVIEARNSEGLTPLLLAAQSWSSNMTSNQLEILDLLLEKNANVHVKMPLTDKTPLHLAVGYGLVDATERLLEYGADLESRTREGKVVLEIWADRKRQHGCGNGCESCLEVRRLIDLRKRKFSRI